MEIASIFLERKIDMAKKKLKICVTVGHSRLKNGAYTSADGRQYGGVIEYKYCRDFAKLYLVPQLRASGHDVNLIICPEGQFTDAKQEKDYKLSRINEVSYDLVMEIHLNSAQPSAHGTEVLYVSSKGKGYAEKIVKALGEVYTNRGAKKRTDLYILNGTKPTAVLLELFFCTNKQDYLKGHGKKNATNLAKLIANSI